MRTIPLAYTLFRIVWSSAHIILAGLAFSMIAIWFFHDNQGQDLMDSIWTTLTGVQYTIAHAIPFPWGG